MQSPNSPTGAQLAALSNEPDGTQPFIPPHFLLACLPVFSSGHASFFASPEASLQRCLQPSSHSRSVPPRQRAPQFPHHPFTEAQPSSQRLWHAWFAGLENATPEEHQQRPDGESSATLRRSFCSEVLEPEFPRDRTTPLRPEMANGADRGAEGLSLLAALLPVAGQRAGRRLRVREP